MSKVKRVEINSNLVFKSSMVLEMDEPGVKRDEQIDKAKRLHI